MANVKLSSPARANCPRCKGKGQVVVMMHPDGSPLLGLCGCVGPTAFLIIEDDDEPEWPEEIEVENENTGA